MKVIVNEKLYEMGNRIADRVLEIAGEQIPYGVYAVEKDGIIELRKDTCRDEKELNQFVVDFQKKGFKVYFNREGK